MKFEQLGRALTTALCLGLAACGGGGGGGGGGGSGAGGDPAGSWLTFSPAKLELSVFPNTRTPFAIKATSNKTIAQQISLAVIDTQGVTQGDATLTAFSPLEYSMSMTTNAALAVGMHSGSFEVRLCYDANPQVCSRPVEGSPWRVPYSIKVIDPASLSYSRWEEGDTTPGFLNDFALSSIGDVPYVVSAGFYTGVMEVRTSANLGTDWTLVSTNSPPPLSRGFALAGDGDAIYLSGGQAINAYSKPTGVYRSHVWKFDGANWQQRTPSASFAGREGHVMAKVGLRLYVAGGRQASTQFNDLWMSIDEGINWNQVASMLPPALGRPTCALDWQGRLLLIGNSVVSSADGTTWTEHGGRPASFPSGSTQCAVMNGRLFINAKDGNSQAVSTNDLATWQLERPMSMWSNAPGMAAVNGRLLITTGSGTTYLPTYRTVP